MESKRFEIVASTAELITEPEKNAVRIELQYGKAGKPTELVFAELYNKEGKWNYTRSQVRIECTAENANYILKAVKALYDSSAKVEKKAEEPKAGLDVSKMSDAQKAELLAQLLGQAQIASKATAPKATTPTTKAPTEELKLENITINHRKIGKK